jgi:hypothetical protein
LKRSFLYGHVIHVIERVLTIYGRVIKRSQTAGESPAYELSSERVAIDYTMGLADNHDWFDTDIRGLWVRKFTMFYLPIVCAT